MLIDLHSVRVSLTSHDERILEHWQHLFAYELVDEASGSWERNADIFLEAVVDYNMPPLPSWPPIYESVDPVITVFKDDSEQLLLRYSDSGYAQIRLSTNKLKKVNSVQVLIVFAEPSINTGTIEDLTLMGLAPLLRRQGLFLIHAFAASRDNEAVLFVGPSGSGKTSSGLALLEAGWQYLANDLAILSSDVTPCALLSPGTIKIARDTFFLLPSYEGLVTLNPFKPGHVKVSVPRQAFVLTEAMIRPAPIRTVLFPSIVHSPEHQMRPIPRAIGFARLMASSMDKWDQGIWDEHMEFLENMSYKVEFFDLFLGANMNELSHFLHDFLLH